MVVCKIELWPGGDKDAARPLGTVLIRNNGTGTAEKGNYGYKLTHAGKFINRKGAFKQGIVNGFKRTLSPYRLLCRVLRDAGEV